MNGKPTENFELLFEGNNLEETQQIIQAALEDQAHENEEWEKHFAALRQECLLTVHDADRIVNDILKLREEHERVKAMAAQRLAQLETDEKRMLYIWQPALEAFTHKHHGNRKSVTLLSGILAHRAVPARIVVEDEAATIAWAIMNSKQCVKYTPSLVKKEVDAYVERTSELPPGTDRKPAGETFSIKGVSKNEHD